MIIIMRACLPRAEVHFASLHSAVRRKKEDRNEGGRKEYVVQGGVSGQCNYFERYTGLMHDIIHLSKAIQCKTQRLDLN